MLLDFILLLRYYLDGCHFLREPARKVCLAFGAFSEGFIFLEHSHMKQIVWKHGPS